MTTFNEINNEFNIHGTGKHVILLVNWGQNRNPISTFAHVNRILMEHVCEGLLNVFPTITESLINVFYSKPIKIFPIDTYNKW